METFLRYLERQRGGLFLLSVAGRSGDAARGILRIVCSELGEFRTRVAVWDALDLWVLKGGDLRWVLLDRPLPPADQLVQPEGGPYGREPRLVWA